MTKALDHAAAMAMYADSDRRATAGLIEMLVAATLLKLNPPARGDDVVSVSVSPEDVEETIRTHSVLSSYEGDTMTITIAPLPAVQP